MARKHEFTWRLGVVYLIVIIVAGAIVVKALHVQIWEGEEWRSKSRAVSFKDFEVAPNRGDIRAEDGRLLASSVPYYALRFDCVATPDEIFNKGIDSLALCLSRFFKDASASAYKKKIVNGRKAKKPNRYLLLNRRKVTYTELKEIKRFPIFRERGTKSGLVLEQEYKRLQPHEDLAERTVGYVSEAEDGSFEGRVGLEGAYESELKGKPGRSIRQMMSGRWVAVTVEDPVDGNDVITTINVDYQDIAQTALKKQLAKFGASSGTAILMEVKTGDVKAITNLVKSGNDYREILNHAIGNAAEPGSVFKAAVVMALLEDGYVQPEDTVDLGNGVYTYYKRSLHESSKKMRGKVTVKEMFASSSNGFSKVVNDCYKDQPQKFIDRLYSFGLNKKLGVELVGEGEPYIKYPVGEDGKKAKDWYGTTLPWMSIGYELKITPLQLLAFYNGIANDGEVMKPRFVKEIRHGGRVVREIDTEVLNSHLCSGKTIRQLKEMMEAVVDSGTAMNLRDAACRIAGKTGTAWIAVPGKGFSGKREYRATFVGYFPADNPLYSCIVSVEGVRHYANVVSGDVFKEIANKIYSQLSVNMDDVGCDTLVEALPVSKNGLKDDFLVIYDELDFDVEDEKVKEHDWVLTTRENGEVVLEPRTIIETLVPNVKGMGLRDAIYLLENSGLKVGVSGSGMVSKQSLTPGSKVRRGSYIQIELR